MLTAILDKIKQFPLTGGFNRIWTHDLYSRIPSPVKATTIFHVSIKRQLFKLSTWVQGSRVNFDYNTHLKHIHLFRSPSISPAKRFQNLSG